VFPNQLLQENDILGADHSASVLPSSGHDLSVAEPNMERKCKSW
jgi:hypothetical protein